VMRDLQAADSAIAVELVTVGASDSREIDAAFVAFAGKRVDALVVGTDPFSSAGASRSLPSRRAMACQASPTRGTMPKPVV
jgi:hypothetical protein